VPRKAAQRAVETQRMTEGPADLIVVGGTIHSLDGACASPEAFAVRADRFVFAGPAPGAMALRGPATRVFDARGMTVIPGLIDAHLHLTNLGLTLDGPDLSGALSLDEVVTRTAAFARSARGDWILGRGWDQNLWPDGAFPTHHSLSAAIPDRPVALARVDGHAVLANARAMSAAGVFDSTPDPAGGRIVRDAQGKPSGSFVDAAADLIHAAVPAPTHDRLVEATRAAIAECNRWGITAVAEPGCGDDVLAAHVALIERGEYSIRNHAMLHDEPALVEAHVRRGITDGAYGGRLWVRSIKTYADGALGSRGAALLEPYADDPGNRGLILPGGDRIAELTEYALSNGWQICCHAIGDRANRTALDAFEAALRRVPAEDPRLRIEHAQVIAPSDIPRFAKLGVIASVQATHRVSDAAWAPARLGAARMRGAYAWRSLLDADVRLANGTDAPVESASTPRTFHASISHPDQPMTRREALASMTTWAARANFQERVAGSITPGKYGDFVVLDREWMTVAPGAIEGTEILATYFGGRRVYPKV
jgi:predicted amidohydrolase YtcJ